MNDMLGRMAIKATVHGFRSSFSDWANDTTDYGSNIIEACLAHSLGQVERAYRRGDALEKRRAPNERMGELYHPGLNAPNVLTR